MSDQPYIRFIPRADNVDDPISAEHINELQNAFLEKQKGDFRQADQNLLANALFNLENHPAINSMIIDVFEDASRMNLGGSQYVRYDEDIRSIVFDETGEMQGMFATRMIANGSGKPFRKLILIVNEYKPTGTDIHYEISYDGIEFFPIQPNSSIPLEVGVARPEFTLRVHFSKDTTLETEPVPRLDGWALLYQDDAYSFRFLDNGITIDIENGSNGTTTV